MIVAGDSAAACWNSSAADNNHYVGARNENDKEGIVRLP
jgi:hypothetical protein